MVVVGLFTAAPYSAAAGISGETICSHTVSAPSPAAAAVHSVGGVSTKSFAKLSVNYSADLKTRVEPCIFGGPPDCSQCGCAISIGLHGIQKVKVGGFIPVGMLVQASTAVGAAVNRLRPTLDRPSRWSAAEKAA